MRADALEDLTADGWMALVAHGVRTVIDLRNDDEVGEDVAPRSADVTTIRIPLDVSEDREFWDVWQSGPQFGTPEYYRPHLERFPERSAAVVAAVAQAEPGGVAVHCAGGRDRSGQVTMLLLSLVGVPPDIIATDYALSFDRLPARYAARGEDDQGPLLQSYLRAHGTSAETLIVDLLESFDVEDHLVEAGLGTDDIAALRGRLLGGKARRRLWDDDRVARVDVVTETIIRRPRDEVAAFAADPSRAPEWYQNIKAVEWETEPPVQVGSRVRFRAVFLGRTLVYTYEIREFVPGERLVMATAEGPFPMQTEYTWADVDDDHGATRMTLRNHGEPSGFAGLGAPVMARAMRRANAGDLALLKRLLEG